MALNINKSMKKLLEKKAGIIPFTNDGKMLFMISSDFNFGGKKANISKGDVDGNETFLQAAIREGSEELGLIPANFLGKPFEVFKGTIKSTNTYSIVIYAVEVKDKKAFNKPHYETKETVWLTNKEFQKTGRKSHRTVVNDIWKVIPNI